MGVFADYQKYCFDKTVVSDILAGPFMPIFRECPERCCLPAHKRSERHDGLSAGSTGLMILALFSDLRAASRWCWTRHGFTVRPVQMATSPSCRSMLVDKAIAPIENTQMTTMKQFRTRRGDGCRRQPCCLGRLSPPDDCSHSWPAPRGRARNDVLLTAAASFRVWI